MLLMLSALLSTGQELQGSVTAWWMSREHCWIWLILDAIYEFYVATGNSSRIAMYSIFNVLL
jgi:hypothetical protein